MPHIVRVRTRPNDLCSSGRLSMRRDLAIELRWPGDHERYSRLGARHSEAMRAIAWYEYEAACGSGPFTLVAEAGELAREKIEHLVLTGMHMFVHGQPRWVR